MSTMESAAIQPVDGDATTDAGTQPESTDRQSTGLTGNGRAGNGQVSNGQAGNGLVSNGQVSTEQRTQEAYPLAGEDPGPRRRSVTIPQVIGGILIAGICVAAALWYVPRIVRADNRSFTGTVSSSGVTNLNFANSGLVGKVPARLGQAVHAGQVLATETSPSTTAAISADHAAIAAGHASLAQLRAGTPAASTKAAIAAAGAQLAKDQAQLASDKVKLAETQIIAPTAGTIIAINGQAGETVTAAGIRSYSAQTQAPGAQSPPFSLLPEGPAANVKTSTTQSALPMIALRTSSSWQVTVLVPENAISQVHPGQHVTIAVPAVTLTKVPGTIQQVSPTPVTTSTGTAYQAIVRITGHQHITPLGGMTANIQLGS